MHWNRVIARNVEQSILHQAMGIANIGAQRKIVNTALYVLLHRTITAGCPLQNEERTNYLSTFRGSSAEGILLSSGEVCMSGLSERAMFSDNHEIDDTIQQHPNDINDLENFVDSMSLTNNVIVSSLLSEKVTSQTNQSNSKPSPQKLVTKQSLSLKKNVQKNTLGSPGNTAPRLLRVKTPSSGSVTTTRPVNKANSSTIKSGEKLTSPSAKITSSSSKMSTSFHHLRTASPANLGRIASTSKTINSKDKQK